jgi:hypothetical protein
MLWIILLTAVIVVAFFHYVMNYRGDVGTYGCNIEDDDIRSEALISRIEKQTQKQQQMKTHLQEFLQEKMSDLGIEK